MATATAKVACKFGDDVSTDIIYPGRYMATVLPAETPQFAFADDPLNGRLKKGEVPRGSVLVGGKNFGCGSSREQAVSTLKGWELTVVAEGIARIFLQNSINLGLKVVIAPGVEASEGDELDLQPGKVVNVTTGKEYPTVPMPPSRQSIMDAGGLIAWTRQRLVAGSGKAG